MFGRSRLVSVISVMFVSTANLCAAACDSCGCSLSRVGTEHQESLRDGRWFVDFAFEQVHWDKIPAETAHELHEQGHHIHDRTHEEFYFFGAGRHAAKRLTVFLQIPYVVRQSLQIHDHETLGAVEKSEGWGDLKLSGIYRLIRKEENFAGLVAGVKFPTGETDEKNAMGELFEPELQPGSGSFDASAGATFRYDAGRASLRGNALYVFKTEGDLDFEFGDLFTSYLFVEYWVNPESKSLRLKPGVDLNLQVEDRQQQDGREIEDSGGTSVLVGPALNGELNDRFTFFANVLFPVHQDLGGFHQEIDWFWNLSLRFYW